MPNVELNRYSRPAMFRRMALVSWGRPSDPQVYARAEVDVGKALEFARQESERAGVSVTPAHLVLRAVALALREYRDANAIVRWNRIYTRKRVHVFFHVAVPGKKPDLSGVVVRDADAKDPAAIAGELREKVKAVRSGSDEDLARTRRMLDRIPSCLYRPLLGAIGFLQYTLNLDLSRLGMPRDAFGGAAVTSVGSFGVSEAFAPLPPITRLPILVSVGKVEQRPAVRDGAIVIRPTCVLCATFDHRIMDGYLAGKLAKFVTRYLADPQRYEMERQV
jgi:pyruvate dehydrogenase E2 component (dihydrolipoamide acetyltransferase)